MKFEAGSGGTFSGAGSLSKGGTETLTLTGNTFETLNGDTEESSFSVNVEIRPDADAPTTVAAANPATGTEDQATPYALDLSAFTPDPHEEIESFAMFNREIGLIETLPGGKANMFSSSQSA